MRIAFVGCGYVANMYRLSLPLHPQLQLVGVADRDAARAAHFASLCGCRAYESLESLLDDKSIDLVLNLTNPGSHYDVTRTCLVAGKHVYSEKPLAMDVGQARELVELAESNGLCLASAPCTLLSEVAQTTWKALREQAVGRVRLVYAEMDDGMVHRMPVKSWVNEAGTPWPYRDEFLTGCTVEHAGYVLTWLAAFFGPATSVAAFSDCLIPEKLDGECADAMAPDFSVACVRFRSGVVARLTCGVVAPLDHRFMIVGDDGIMTVADPRSDRAPLHVQRYLTIRRKRFLAPWRRRVPLLGRHLPQPRYRGAQRRDFCRGIAEMAEAIREKRSCRLNGRFSLHVNELTLAIQNARDDAAPRRITSTFDPITPMPWAA